MSFISVLLALLLEQARPLGQGNRIHAAMRSWVRWSARSFDAGKSLHGWLAWVFAVGLPTLATLALYWWLEVTFGWPVAVAWSVAVLYATLGFRQFSFHYTEIRDALAGGDEDRARELLANWRQIDASELSRSDVVREVVEHSVLAAHRHVFGVLAWFSLLAALGLGPAGAVLYRLSEFVARYWRHKSSRHHQPASEALQQFASDAWGIVDWLPARITAISFAVVGSFEEAIDSWRSYQPRSTSDNDGVILAATSGAVGVSLGSGARAYVASPGSEPGQAVTRQAPEYAHLAVIVGLIWRTVVMWMVMLALLTLARLLG